MREPVISANGARTTCYHDNGTPERVEWPDGVRAWYHDDGRIARVEHADGTRRWFRARDKPRLREYPDGSRIWYDANGKQERFEPACQLRAELFRIRRDLEQCEGL